MRKSARRPIALALGAAALAVVGCAHARGAAPAPDEEQPPERGRQQDEKVFVTGSRIPQRVDAGSGLPATAWPVRIYSRRDLARTGRPETSDALRRLDPSIP